MNILLMDKTKILIAAIFFVMVTASYGQGYIAGPPKACVGQPAVYFWGNPDRTSWYEGNWYIKEGTGTIKYDSPNIIVTWQSGPGVLALDLSCEVWSNCDMVTLTLNVPVENGAPPVPTVTGASRFGGGTLTLTANSPGATSYNWYNASGALVGTGPTYQTPGIGSSRPNMFTVKAVSCAESIGTSVDIKILPIPQILADKGSYLALGRAELTVSSEYDAYVWKNTLGQTRGTTRSVAVSEPGAYTVTVTEDNISYTSAPRTIFDQFSGLNMNFIEQYSIKRPIQTPGQLKDLVVNHCEQVVSYFDGLGRLTQRVQTQASPSKRDVIYSKEYNRLGLEANQYTPYVSPLSNGRFRTGATQIIETYEGNILHQYEGSEHNLFYQQPDDKIADDPTPFSRVEFEQSPLRRVLKETGPGRAWQVTSDVLSNNDKTSKTRYFFNQANEVAVFSYDMTTKLVTATTPLLYYAANQLYAVKTYDPDNNEEITYSDKQGRTIMKRMATGEGYADTYYVYDEFENIVVVLSPEASKKMITETSYFGQTDAVKTTFLNAWTFRYQYDERGRMAQKKVPGADWVYMVYDGRDRLLLTQDGNQRQGNYWTFTKYDMLNRPVLTGIKDTVVALSQEAMQQVVNSFYTKNWTKGSEIFVGYSNGNVHGYTNKSYPVCTSGSTTDENHYIKVFYYDNYSFKGNWYDGDYDYHNAGLSLIVGDAFYQQQAEKFDRVIGKLTGSKVKILDDGVRGGYAWLKKAAYYDDNLRVTQTVSEIFKGGIDRQSTLYDFIGKVLKTKDEHEEFDVTWTDLLGVRVIGNKLYRNINNNAWGQSGAASARILPAGQDGWVEFTASETNTSRMLGLSDENINAHNNTIDYAIYLRDDGVLTIREKVGPTTDPVEVKMFANGYKPGDVLRIARVNTAIKYYRNGIEIYPADAANNQRPSTSQLLVDVAFATSGGSLVNIKTSFSSSSHTIARRFEYDHADRVTGVYHALGQVPTWTPLAMTSVDGYILKKNSTNATWDAGAISAEVVPASADGWMEFRAGSTTMLRAAGFTKQTTATTSYTHLDYGVYLRDDGVCTIYEAGQQRDISRQYDANDIFRVERKGGTVYYRVNNELFYTSSVASTPALHTAAAFYSSGSFITHIFMGTGSGTSEVQLSRHTYNELGQLIDKDLHSVSGGPFKQSIDYRYNVRGWLTSINNASLENDLIVNDDGNDITDKDYFGMNLEYNTSVLNMGNNTLFNGNITAIAWSANLGLDMVEQRGYTYQYDALGRLRNSVFGERIGGTWRGIANSGSAETGITYDLNGNILFLTRNDRRTSSKLMDVLTYDYGTGTAKSNQLLKVTDAGDKNTGFIDGNNTGDDYTYDANGNLRRDLNKGIGTSLSDNNNLITYNFLNLPQTVTKGGNTIRYIYDSDGQKLSEQVGVGDAIKKTDYVGQFIYVNDALQWIIHEEGRVVMAKETQVYSNNCENTDDVTAQNATIQAISINGRAYIKGTATSNARPGIFPIGNGISVLVGERYKIRAKGYRLKGTASASHAINLLIKVNGNDLGWPGALIPEGSSAVTTDSWVEQIVTIPVTGTLEAGIVGGSTIVSGEEVYLSGFEIVKLGSDNAEYQYFMKDHLGNVRLTFTATPAPPTNYKADFEGEDDGSFLNYSNSTFDLVDHTDAGMVHRNVQYLNGGDNGRVGVAKSISVMPGDKITAKAYCKYMHLSSTPNTSTLISSLASAFGVSAASAGDNLALYQGLNNYAGLVTDGDHADDDESVPKIFVTILFFDKNYNLVDAAWDQVSDEGAQTSSTIKEPPHDELSITATAPEAGYAYVFVSNEHPTLVDVYFDDVTFTHIPSAIVAMDDYYPFGLTYNSRARENSMLNTYQYNGKEIQNELNIGWLDYGARMYMPEIGRWGVIDPLSYLFMNASPYVYALNRPTTLNDIEGLLPGDPKYTGTGNVVIILTYGTGDRTWDPSTLDKTGWDYGVFGSLSDAAAWMNSTYKKNGVSVKNLVVRTHGYVPMSKDRTGELNVPTPENGDGGQRYLSPSLLAEGKYDPDVIALSEIGESLGEEANVLFTACNACQFTDNLPEAIFKLFNGGSKDIRLFTNGTTTSLRYFSGRVKVGASLSSDIKKVYAPWKGTTSNGTYSLGKYVSPGLDRNGSFTWFYNGPGSSTSSVNNGRVASPYHPHKFHGKE